MRAVPPPLNFIYKKIQLYKTLRSRLLPSDLFHVRHNANRGGSSLSGSYCFHRALLLLRSG